MKFRVLFFASEEPSSIDIRDSDGRAIYGGWWDGRDNFMTPYLDAEDSRLVSIYPKSYKIENVVVIDNRKKTRRYFVRFKCLVQINDTYFDGKPKSVIIDLPNGFTMEDVHEVIKQDYNCIVEDILQLNRL